MFPIWVETNYFSRASLEIQIRFLFKIKLSQKNFILVLAQDHLLINWTKMKFC